MMRRNWLVIEGKILAGALSVAFIATVIEAGIDKGLALAHIARHLGLAVVIALGMGVALWWLDRPNQKPASTIWPFIALTIIVIMCIIAAHFL